MRSGYKIGIVLIIWVVSSASVFAQSANKNAAKYYLKQDYAKALSYYLQARNVEKDKVKLAKRGICYYHVGELEKAASDLTAAYDKGNEHAELKYYMGRINHSQRKFEEAILFYKTYLRELKANEEIRPDVALHIRHCFSGMQMEFRSTDLGLVENVGNIINTEADELNPVPSSNYVNRFYYSSNRAQDHFDLYSAEMLEGVWTHSDYIHQRLNGSENEMMQDVSIDGSAMVFLRGDGDRGNRLYLNRFSQSKHNQRVIFSETKAVSGDKDVYLVNDEIMIFSSNRPGGYGGYDLYISEFSSKGWSKPKNLGPEINSGYDERYPFLNEDQTDIFFSSNRTESIGGFDIFSSKKKNDKWGNIQFYSYPLNSPENEFGFRIQEDGFQAYFSSDRVLDNEGGYDIYTVFLRQAYRVHSSEPRQPLSLIRSSVKDPDYTDPYVEKEINPKQKEPSKKQVKEIDEVAKEKEEIVEASKEEKSTDVTPVKPEKTTKKDEPIKVVDVEKQEPIKKDVVVEQKEEEPTIELPKKEEISEETVASSDEKEITNPDKKSEEIPSIKEKPRQKTKKKKAPTDVYSGQGDKSPDLAKDINKVSFQPIIYGPKEDLLNHSNKTILDALVLEMRDAPLSQVFLTCHSLPEGLPEFEMMFSIKRVEKISDYLKEQGIAADRIIIRGVGSAYPYIKKVLDENLYNEVKNFNNRIDIKLRNVRGSSMVEQPNIDEILLSPSYALYQTVTEDVYFRVFVHETEKKMYKNAILRYYNDLMIEQDSETGRFRYFVGLYTDFKSAFELRRELANRNIQDVRIVAYQNGIELSKSDATLLKSEYPELVNFLEINQ